VKSIVKQFLLSLHILLSYTGLCQDFGSDFFEWAREDLKVTKFRNGESIFFAQSDEDWEQASNEGRPAYCFVQGDQAKGVLYNWFAVNDPRGLAPEGYRLPSTLDFEKIIASGIELKSRIGNWVDQNIIQNSEFNAIAKGYRSFDGSSFLSDGYINYYWSSDKGKALYAQRLGIVAGQNPLIDQGRREDGCSVRLIRDFKVSIMPSQIYSAKTVVKPNEKIVLKLTDGSLGEGAEFYWFVGQCPSSTTTSFASGRVISCSLKETSDVYVAIFKGSKKIGCKSINITVRDESIIPSSIIGGNSACAGGYVDLRLDDGELCTTCEWYWYDSPDFYGQAIGQGSTLSVKSTSSKQYYVRSESRSTGKVTDAISKYITIYQVPPDPTSISYTSGSEICSGDLLQCSVKGPDIGNSTWIWVYDGKEVEGQYLKTYLYKSTSLKVYARNFCGRSANPLSEFITVNSKSISPTNIEYGKEKGKTYLIQKGGVTGTDAEWEWYRLNNKMSEKHVGTGEKIFINPRKSSTYIVRAEGGKCESNAQYAANFNRIPKAVGSTKWSPYYANSKGRLHFGTDIGLGMSFLNEKVLAWDSVNYFEKSGFDLNWNVNSHLINKEFFMLGINGGMSAGMYKVPEGNYLYKQRDNLYGVSKQEYYTYSGKFGAELLIGFLRKGKAKLLVNYNQSITYNVLTFKYLNNLDEDFDYYLNQETIGCGLRIGSNGQYNKSKQLDILFVLNDFNNRSTFSERNYSYFGYRQMGLQCNFWLHSALRINSGILFSNYLKDYSLGNYNRLGAFVSIAYSWDRFR
jgi:uncharacterized protein (TIGR02145 family)